MSDRSYISVSQGTTAVLAISATTASNALCLGGALANTYAPLANPTFTGEICAPIVCATSCVRSPLISGSSVVTGGICIKAPSAGGGNLSLLAPVGSKDSGDIVFYTGATTTGSEWARIWTDATNGCLQYRTACGALTTWCIYHSGNFSGGLVWTGNTNNGIGTYSSSGTICSEPNLTFNGTTLSVAGNISLATGADRYVCIANGAVNSLYLKGAENASLAGGNVYVCGGESVSSSSGCVYLSAGPGSPNGCVILAHGNNVKLYTISTGIQFNGNLNFTSTASRSICMDSTTTSPACTLTIQGTGINAASGYGGNVNIYGGCSSGTSSNCGGCINIIAGCACNTNAGAALGGNVAIFAGDSYNNNNSAINIGGNVCIRGGNAKCVSGSASVGGTVNICGGTGTTHGNVNIYAGGDLVFVACQNGGAGCAALYYDGVAKFCTVTNGICLGANCGIGTDWVGTSDSRLKCCVAPILNALSIVIQLEGVRYQFCDDINCENRIGLIAQDVEKILPEVVSYSEPSEEDAKYGITDEKLGLKYDKLTAVLIEAIKEQQTQINDLKLEINNLINK